MKKLVTIYKLKIILFILIVSSIKTSAQDHEKLASLSEVLTLAKNKNYIFINADFQQKIAELTKKTAIGNGFNPRIPANIQALDNINQQVSFLPAEAFGGVAGTFKQVTIGQQYVSTFGFQPQFDIINLSGFAQVKSSEINVQLVENQNKINEQILYDKIDAIYFNILSFNGQKEILLENIIIAENIFKIISQKFNEGVARKQEVNEAEVNVISLKDKLEQLEINTKIQYQILNLFLENQISSDLTESVWNYENQNQELETKNNIQIENVQLQKRLATQEYKSLKYQNFPSLSFVSSFNWQNLSNEYFFNSKSNYTNFNYVGLKLNFELPTVQRLANTKSKQIQLKILSNNEEHIKKETESKNEQMILEYEKSIKQTENLKKIFTLKKDTYEKNYNQFIENILPLDKLLISQNDLLISKINVVLALANIGFNKNKIEINNKF